MTIRFHDAQSHFDVERMLSKMNNLLLFGHEAAHETTYWCMPTLCDVKDEYGKTGELYPIN